MIANTDFSIDKWNDPKYANLVQLVLWAISAGAISIFTSITRSIQLWRSRKSHTLVLIFNIKVLMLLFDQFSGCLLLYTYLISLGKSLFSSNANTALLLSVIILSPFTGMLSNTIVNLPLLYSFYRTKSNGPTRMEVLKKAIVRTFSPMALLFTLLAIYNTSVTIFILNKLQLIDVTRELANIGEILAWNPQRIALWFVCINLVINYIAGVVTTIAFLSIMTLKSGCSIFSLRNK